MRTLQNAVEHDQVRQAYLFAGPRGTGKTSMARILAKALNCAGTPGPVAPPGQDLPRLPRDRERHLARRRRDGRRLAARHRRHPRDPRARRAAARRGALQGLHPRRGAPAHPAGVAGAPEADRGASAPPRLRLLHDRALQRPADGPVALSDLRLPAAAAPRAGHAPAPRRRGRGDPGARLRAVADSARRAWLLPRRRLDARPAGSGDQQLDRCAGSAPARRRRRGGVAPAALRHGRRPRHGRSAALRGRARRARAGPRPPRHRSARAPAAPPARPAHGERPGVAPRDRGDARSCCASRRTSFPSRPSSG